MLSVKKIFAATALSLCISMAQAGATTDFQLQVKNYDNLMSQVTEQINNAQNEINSIDERIATAKRLIAGINLSTESSDNIDKIKKISERLISRKSELSKSLLDNQNKIDELLKSKQSFINNQTSLVTQSTYTNDIQSSIDQAKLNNEKLLAERAKLEEQVKNVEKELSDLKLKNDQLVFQKKDYESFMAQVDNDIKESQKTLSQKKQQSDDFKSLITEQDKQNATLQKKIADQKTERTQKEKDLNDIIELQKSDKALKESELNKVIAEEELSIKILNDKKEAIKQQNQKVSSEIADAQKVFESNVAVKEQMTKKIQNLENDLISSKQKIKEINNQNIALFEAAKRSLVQNNQDIDSINTSEANTALKNTNTSGNSVGEKPKEIPDNMVSPIILVKPKVPVQNSNEKNILVTKSLSGKDQFIKDGKTNNIYIVKKGDTLGTIISQNYSPKNFAERKGILLDIEKLNSLSRNSILSVGQTLVMPNYDNL